VPEPPVISDRVTIDYPVDLHLVSDITGVSPQEIVALNPSLLRMTTPQDASFDLHLPPGTRDAYLDRIKEIPEDKRTSWRFHVVRAGESLDEIAAMLHARPGEIAQVNQIASNDTVATGDELVVPVVSSASTHPQRYTVRRGDTLVTVADRFGVSADALRRWNHLSSNSLKPGATLTVAEPVKLAPATHTRSRARRSSSASIHTTSSKSKTSSTHAKSKATSSGSKSTATSSRSKSTSSKAKPKAAR
jgi:membrane-bound lytic murein transglycosylase D